MKLTAAAACALFLCIGLAQGQGAAPPAFDPAKMRAELEAFNKKPDTAGTGPYPALKDRKSTRLNSSHLTASRIPSSA